MSRRIQNVTLSVLSVVLLIALYAYLSHRQHKKNPDDTTIPTAKQLWEGIKKAVAADPDSGERWIAVDSKATASRLFLGLGVGVLGSIVIGLLMGSFHPVEAFMGPPLRLLAKVPPTAALAVFFVMVGTDTEMYVAMIAFGILPTLAQSVYLAVRDVPSQNADKALTLGGSRAEILYEVVFKQIRPKIIDAIRLQIGPAMVYLIAAEMVCSDQGFGYRIRLQSRLLEMNVVYPYIALLAGFGFLMDAILKGVIRIWCPWYSPQEIR